MNINDSLFCLKDQVIILTGGSGLIGLELLKQLPKYGAQVVIGIRDVAKLDEKLLTIDYPENINKPICHFLDISDQNSIVSFFKTVMNNFTQIDAMINNAWPKTHDWLNKFEDVSAESLYKNLCAHAGGYFLCCQEVASVMKKQKCGVILNMGSIYGEVGPHFSIYEGTDMTCPSAYSIIKGGIHTFTKYLATYLAPYRIRVNCLSPGGIYDKVHQPPEFVNKSINETPLGRMGNPEDIVWPSSASERRRAKATAW